MQQRKEKKNIAHNTPNNSIGIFVINKNKLLNQYCRLRKYRMDRNNGRYPYIRRQGSGNGPHNHHHHNNANSSTTSSTSSSSSSASAGTNSSHSTQYSNNSTNNAPTNTNVQYAASAQQQQQQQQQSVPISQHDELIRYIRDAWCKVREQDTQVFYCTESDNQLKNFKPFNLEEYWGQRLVQNIHVTTTHQ